MRPVGHTHDANSVSGRVERLLDEIDTTGDTATARTAEELVRTLMEFYGDGLSRIVELIGSCEGGDATLRQLADDRIVGGLLVLHELHPDGTGERVEHALEQVRPYLGSHSGDVELLGITDDVVRLRLQGSCHGCPSSMVTVKLAIEQAIESAAPEITSVEVEGVVEDKETGPGGRPLLPLQATSTEEPAAAQRETTPPGAAWVDLDDLGELPPGELLATRVAGVAAVVCDVDGDLYAYRDRCPECGTPLASAALLGSVLRCGSCGIGYDVRLAGKGVGQSAAHLDPLPLLSGDGQVRVAVPAGAMP